MNVSRNLFLTALVALSLLASGWSAQAGEPRQFYGKWHKGQYYAYRQYFFKPTADYEGYKHHIVIHYYEGPESQYYYYYNPETKKFWGRAPVHSCHPCYSMLDVDDQAGSLNNIPEKAFPAATTPPTIPQTPEEKKADPKAPRLQLPPDEPPPSFTAAAN